MYVHRNHYLVIVAREQRRLSDKCIMSIGVALVRLGKTRAILTLALLISTDSAKSHTSVPTEAIRRTLFCSLPARFCSGRANTTDVHESRPQDVAGNPQIPAKAKLALLSDVL
jgi:hypothetical protein